MKRLIGTAWGYVDKWPKNQHQMHWKPRKTRPFQGRWNPLNAPHLSLGENCTWIKRSEHTSRSGCADFFNICPKMAILWLLRDLFSLLLWFLPLNYSNVWQRKREERNNRKNIYYNGISLPWSHDFCSERTSFASLTTKPVGPWLLDNIGFKIGFMRASTSVATPRFFSLM